MNQQDESEQNQTTTVIEIIDEIINDKDFIDCVKSNVSELFAKRRRRPAPKDGYRYKRDWYDRMGNAGNLNADFFLKNIKAAWMKKSSLSSEIRNIVVFIGDRSLFQANEIRDKRKKQAEEQTNHQ